MLYHSASSQNLRKALAEDIVSIMFSCLIGDMARLSAVSRHSTDFLDPGVLLVPVTSSHDCAHHTQIKDVRRILILIILNIIIIILSETVICRYFASVKMNKV